VYVLVKLYYVSMHHNKDIVGSSQFPLIDPLRLRMNTILCLLMLFLVRYFLPLVFLFRVQDPNEDSIRFSNCPSSIQPRFLGVD